MTLPTVSWKTVAASIAQSGMLITLSTIAPL
jgi:hypothetical protein